MSPATITSLLVTSELRASRAGLGAVAVSTPVRGSRGARTTSETHTYSVPVVREMPPHQARFLATW